MFNFLLLLFFFSFSAQNIINGDAQFHTFDTKSLFPTSVCSSDLNFIHRSIDRAGFTGGRSTLEVVHKNGPCARRDSSSLTTHSSKANSNVLTAEATETTDYIVRIGFGTPKKYVHLSFDTGSDLTWTQCKPCNPHCYDQEDPIFDPRRSSSYSNISCSDPRCLHSGCDDNATCSYKIRYAALLHSNGFLAQEKLTLTPTEVLSNYVFGCSHDSRGDLGPDATGILGLSRGPLSFVSQTAETYDSYFSYCLPSTTSTNGYLAFGKSDDATRKAVRFTPFIHHPDEIFYFIQILSISVANVELPIHPSVLQETKTIIDSGTTITYLPPKVYKAMRNQFRRHMKTKIISLGDESDTCFHIDKSQNISIPTVSLTFKGNVKVDLDRSGIIYAVNQTIACFAFAAMNKIEDGYSIFGAIQQRTLEMVYDVTNNRLGFRNGGCS